MRKGPGFRQEADQGRRIDQDTDWLHTARFGGGFDAFAAPTPGVWVGRPARTDHADGKAGAADPPRLHRRRLLLGLIVLRWICLFAGIRYRKRGSRQTAASGGTGRLDPLPVVGHRGQCHRGCGPARRPARCSPHSEAARGCEEAPFSCAPSCGLVPIRKSVVKFGPGTKVDIRAA